MSKKSKGEVREFNSLKDLGLEFASPQDEFSYQPDSGSVADSNIAKQEYGIDVDLDAQSRSTGQLGTNTKIEDPTTPVPGESSYSQDHRSPIEEDGRIEPEADDHDLFELVHDRIRHHPGLSQAKILVRVKSGVVTLRGKVQSDHVREMVNGIVEALPGVSEITNELQIAR